MSSEYDSSELESNMNQADLVDRLPVLRRRFISNLFHRPRRLFIQSVTKTIHHTQNLDVTVCAKPHLQRYVALDLQPASLRRVLRARGLSNTIIEVIEGCTSPAGAVFARVPLAIPLEKPVEAIAPLPAPLGVLLATPEPKLVP